jgi:hypothetical protein
VKRNNDFVGGQQRGKTVNIVAIQSGDGSTRIEGRKINRTKRVASKYWAMVS